MDAGLSKIKRWASHGTPRQFFHEVDAKATAMGYTVKQEGNHLIVFRQHREGGFLGIGAKKVRDVVLEVKWADGEADLLQADDEFINTLAPMLRQH